MSFSSIPGLVTSSPFNSTPTLISQFRLVALHLLKLLKAGRVVELLIVLATNESLTYPGIKLPKSASSNS